MGPPGQKGSVGEMGLPGETATTQICNSCKNKKPFFCLSDFLLVYNHITLLHLHLPSQEKNVNEMTT